MNFYLFLIVSITSVFTLNFSAHSQTAPDTNRIHIPKIVKPKLNLNGLVDDEDWKQAVKIVNFVNNHNGEPVTETTTLYLFYDNEALYMGFECVDKDVQATYKERDSDLWNEEVMEFFIYPHAEIPNPIDYFELQWNPLGTMFDAVLTNHLDEDGKSKSYHANRSWNADEINASIRVNGSLNVSHDRDQSWSGECKLPFTTFASDIPKPGEVWRANFYRYSRNKGEELVFIAWNPTHSTFHEPNWFGQIIFQ